MIGNSSPRYQYGATLNFSWYGFDVSVFMQGIGRLDWYPGADNLRFWGPYCRPYATFVPKNFMSQVWSEENPDAYFPRARAYTSLNSTQGTAYYTNDRYLQNLAYCRLKNLQLSYTFPSSVTKALRIHGLMVYANATNLFTISNYYDGYDPETAYQGGSQGATTGSIGNNYPLVSTYTFGVEIKF